MKAHEEISVTDMIWENTFLSGMKPGSKLKFVEPILKIAVIKVTLIPIVKTATRPIMTLAVMCLLLIHNNVAPAIAVNVSIASPR